MSMQMRNSLLIQTKNKTENKDKGLNAGYTLNEKLCSASIS